MDTMTTSLRPALTSLWVILALSSACADESLDRLVPKIAVCPSEDADRSQCDRALSLGEVPVTIPVTFNVFVASIGTGALRVRDVSSSEDWLVIDEVPQQIARGQTVPVAFTVFLQPSQLGLQTTTLTVTSDDPERGSIDIDVELTGIPKPAPAIVLCVADDCGIDVADFGSVRRTRTVGREIVVQNVGNQELTVADVFIRGSTSFPGEFALLSSTQDAVLQPGQAAGVVVAYEPADDGSDTAEFVVVSDDPAVPEAILSLRGEAPINLPPVAVAVDEVSGETVLTARVEDVLSVDGVDSSDVEGDPLAWRWTLIVPAGSAAVFDDPTAPRARFTPDRAGAYRASLVVVDSLGQTSEPADVLYDVAPRFGFRATLAWASGHDLDLHLLNDATDPIAPGALFGDKDCGGEVRTIAMGAPGPSDDCTVIDDAQSGPATESLVIESVSPGTYGVWVHVFDDVGDGAADAEVSLQVDDGSPIFVRTQSLPSRCSAWHVADITFPGAALSSTTDALAEICR